MIWLLFELAGVLLLAVGAEFLDQSVGTLGKFVYMAPEIADGAIVDARVDLFSFAAMMYHLLSGEPPFGARWNTILERRHSWRLAPLPADVPDDLRDMVIGILRRNPDERRPQTAKVARAMLRPPEERVRILAKLGRMVEATYKPMRAEWDARIATERAPIDAQPVILGTGDVEPNERQGPARSEEVIETMRARSDVWVWKPEEASEDEGMVWRPRRAIVWLAGLAAVFTLVFQWISPNDERGPQPISWQLIHDDLPTPKDPPRTPTTTQYPTKATDESPKAPPSTEPESSDDDTNTSLTRTSRSIQESRPVSSPRAVRPKKIHSAPPSRGPGSPWLGRLQYIR